MRYDFYLMPLLIAFLSSSLLLLLIIFWNRRKSFEDKRITSRHVHCRQVCRFGGVAIIVSFVLALYLDHRLVITQQLNGVFVGALLIMLWGVFDDIRQMQWKTQLFFQIAIVIFVMFMGVRLEYLTNPFGGIIVFDSLLWQILGYIITAFWIIFLMNAINWIDGIDGVSGGISIIATLIIFILSQRPEVNQPPVGIITAALAGSLGAFLFLNFNPAKIIAGTSGSMFMGFILAVLAIFAGAKVATTLLVLAIPILDALWVIGERFLKSNSIFIADKRHLHYRLLQMKFSHRQISLLYYLLTVIIGIIALNTRFMGKLFTFIVFGIFLFFISLLFQRHAALKRT